MFSCSCNAVWDQENEINCWTRILLLQHLAVDTIDILDPQFNRLPQSRRVRISTVKYAPVPR